MMQKGKLRLLVVLLCLAVFSVQAKASLLESRLSCRRFTTHDGLPQMQTETVWQDSGGYIYIGTLSGFVRYDGKTFTPFLGGRRENIVLFRESSGDVRAMGFVRQWHVNGNSLKESQIDQAGELLLNNLNAADLPDDYILLEDRQERNRSLRRILADGMETVLDTPVLDDMTPDRKLYVDSTGIYIPTGHGLYVADGGNMRCLTKKTDIFSLCRTPECLFALAANGVYGIVDDSLVLRCGMQFEAPDYGLSVRQDHLGRLIIADSHTIWRFDNTAPESLQQLASGFNMIKGVFVDKWNRLWAATYQGAYCFFHCDFTNHRLEDNNDIVRAVASCNGHLVMGTLNGKVIADQRIVSSQDGNFFAPGAVTIGDTVYMAGNGDVAAIRDGSLSWLGLPYDRYRFVSRYADRLIIGGGRSVLSYDTVNAHLDTLTMDIVRPWCAAQDGQGRLWISGNPGLYCIDRPESDEVSVRKVVSTPTTPVITAMSSDGERVCYAFGDAVFILRDGKPCKMEELSPTLAGHEIRALHLSPRGHLTVAAIDGLLVARMDDSGIASDIHWFNAENGFTNVEPLMGAMAEEDDGTVWLAGLEEMTSFRPENLLADNQESAIVEKPRPWWQLWWVELSAIMLLAAMVWQVTRLAEQRQARRKMARLEREKTQKELQLQAVRLKAIPHFHSNVLSGIEYFILNKSADEASRYLKLYSDFTNQTLADIDRPSRTVASEIDYVRNYLELEKLRYGERLNYRIDVAPDVDQKIPLPTMLLHTYCQNAVKHGIASKEGAGCVEVIVRRQSRDGAGGVLVAVRDNGIGRSEAARSGGYSTGQGLKILSQQIELYNQTNKHHISQTVIDLTDAGGRAAGTSFEMWVPADFKY